MGIDHARALASLFGALAIVSLAACEKESPVVVQKDPTPPVASVHTSEAVVSPQPAPSPSASASCAPLAWNADHLEAAPATFVGHIEEASGSLPNGSIEPFFVMTLDQPSCDSEGAPSADIQVYKDDDDFKKAFHHRVRIVGEPMAWMTAHHHRPIVVHVTKLTLAD